MGNLELLQRRRALKTSANFTNTSLKDRVLFFFPLYSIVFYIFITYGTNIDYPLGDVTKISKRGASENQRGVHVMRFSNTYRAVVAAAVVGLAIPYANAAVISFDFTTLGSNNTQLDNSVTINNVNATGYQFSGGAPSEAPLWLRDQGSDHGLGVCSSGENCSLGGGDVNELDNNGNYEGILLRNDNGPNSLWSQLFVSSLDQNGTNSAEQGTLLWGNDLNSFADPASFDSSHHFSFSYDDFALGVEGDILSLNQAAEFDPTSLYVGFVAGSLDCQSPQVTTNTVVVAPPNPVIGCGGTNNDYLVWKGTLDPAIDAPEPAALGLFGLALVMLGFGLRRRRTF